MPLDLAGKIFDIYDDPKLQLVHQAPDFIKEASVEDPIGVWRLPDEAFALVIHTNTGAIQRKFPVMTKEAALLSAYYYENVLDDLPEAEAVAIGQRICNSLVKLGGMEHIEHFPVLRSISDRLPTSDKTVTVHQSKVARTVGQSMSVLTKEAEARLLDRLPEAGFALVAETEDGTSVKKFPIFDTEHTRTSLEKFASSYDKLPPKWRAVTARRLKEAAIASGIEVSEEHPLSKYANWDEYSPVLTEKVEERINLCLEKRAEYRELLSRKEQLDPVDFAEELYALDKTAGLDSYYNQLLEDPYATTFDQTFVKQAAPLDLEVLKTMKEHPDRLEKVGEFLTDASFNKLKTAPVSALKGLLAEEKDKILEILRG